MAKSRTRRGARYDSLRLHHFLPLEARELSRLPKNTPALKLVVQERDERRVRFERIAANKIATGSWKRTDVPNKWLRNLARMYSRRRLRVQFGPTGKQQVMPKYSPNPWALYRDAEKRVGGPDSKGYVSPWELKQIKQGKTPLDKGQIFIQKQARKPAPGMTGEWVRQLDEKIVESKGKERQRLVGQRDRLKAGLV